LVLIYSDSIFDNGALMRHKDPTSGVNYPTSGSKKRILGGDEAAGASSLAPPTKALFTGQ